MKPETVRHELAQRALKRAEQWQPIMVRKLPDPEKLHELVLLGAYSYSLPQTRRRLIKDTLVLEANVRETPTAIARDYLTMVYKQGPRVTHRQMAKIEKCPPPPNVARPSKFAHGYYVDIEACYWNIMLITGWNVDYNPGVWLSPGRPPYDYPFPDHKQSRNSLASAGRVAAIPRYNPRKLPKNPYDEIQPGNRLRNMQLNRLIHDTVNGIGWQCLQAGAIYINNDGMIAPGRKVAEACQQIITDWGLTARIKAEGSGDVRASGTYRVGSMETVTHKFARDERPLEILYPPEYLGWLQREFSYFAANRPKPVQ